MSTPPTKNGNSLGSILPTLISSGLLLLVMVGGFWSVADPRASLAKLDARFADYLSLREHEQYKALNSSEREGMRRRIDRLERNVDLVAAEQQKRTGTIVLITTLEKRLEALDRRHEETERRFVSSYTLNDELKALRSELQDLRRRVMVPVMAPAQ